MLSFALTLPPAASPIDETVALLKQEEGFRSKPYRDSRGVLTIGYGTNLAEGISQSEAEYLLRARLAGTYEALTKELPWLPAAPEGQQSAILDMGYQLGVHGVLEFKTMLGSLERGDCQAARRQALESAWARETPARAKRVTERLC